MEGKSKEASFVDKKQRTLHFQRVNAKYELPKNGFNSSTLRFLTKMPETPGPGEYEISLNKGHLNVEEIPNLAFLQRTPRFQDFRNDTPGPGTYEIPGMVDEINSHLRPSRFLLITWQVPPFGSCVPRVISLSASKDTPGPGRYNVQDMWKRKYNNMDAVFKSQTERCISPSYSTRAQMMRGGMNKQLHGRKYDLASQLTCQAISIQTASESRKKRRPARFRDRRQPKKVSKYPFNTTGPRVENTPIPDYPGPGKYNYDDINLALNVGYSGRLTSQSERFQKPEEGGPGPADYQKVQTEMYRKSFNVSIERRDRLDNIANQTKKKCRKIGKNETETTSKFDNTIAICERGGRVLIMKKPYKSSLQLRGKGRCVFLPSNTRADMKL